MLALVCSHEQTMSPAFKWVCNVNMSFWWNESVLWFFVFFVSFTLKFDIGNTPLVAPTNLTRMLVSNRSAAVLKAGGGAAVKEQSVAGRTVSDMREKGKHGIRSSGFVDRRVIVHRSADRGALRSDTNCLFSSYCADALVAAKPCAALRM